MAVKPNTVVLIEGTVDFNRISSHVDGEELAKRVAQFSNSTQKPHTFIELSNIAIIPAAPDRQFNDEETFVYHNKGFNRPKSPEKGRCLTVQNLTRDLPQLFVLDPATGKHVLVRNPEGDLASGTRVRVVARTYHIERQGGIDSINLEAVLVDTPTVPYRNSGGKLTSDALSAYGLQLDTSGAAPAPAAATPAAPQANTSAAPAPAPAAPAAPDVPPAPSVSPSIPPVPGEDPFAATAPTWGAGQGGINVPK